MALYKNINRMKMKTVGAVGFIRLLLLIAGVEPNPGPSDVLVYRYQYLLIEVGTLLLRKLLNIKVSNDFMLYLKTNNKAAKQLQVLLGCDVITDHQKQFLPPLDNSPNTENFDITLLVCFLRNICGLKQYKDPVWKCPASRDRTVEAEITRLKECRNFVVHTGTVYISESDFKQKWSELCQILHRLNIYCGVTNLSEMIEDAYSIPLDDQLKQQHDNILKAWHEAESLFEKGIDQIKIGQSEIKQTQSELKDGQSEIKQTQYDLKDGQSGIKQTQYDLKEGQSEIKQTQYDLKDGRSGIKQTQSDLKGGKRYSFDSICYPRYNFFESRVHDIIPRWTRILHAAKLPKCILDGETIQRDIVSEAKYLQDCATVYLFGEDDFLQNESADLKLFVNFVQEEKSLLGDVKVENITWTDYKDDLKKFHVCKPSVVIVVQPKFDNSNVGLLSDLSKEQLDRVIIYNSSSKKCMLYSDLIKVNFDLAHVDTSGKWSSFLDGYLAGPVQNLLEKQVVSLLVGIAQYNQQLIPRPGQELEKTLFDTLYNDIRDSLNTPSVVTDLFPKAEGKELTAKEKNEIFQDNVVDFIARKAKCLTCDKFAIKFGVKAQIVNEFLNNGFFNYAEKIKSKLWKLSIPEYNESGSTNVMIRSFQSMLLRLGMVFSNMIEDAEKFLLSVMKVLEKLDHLQFELYGILRVAKVEVKVDVPPLRMIQRDLQNDLLSIDGVTGCGTLYGKLTLHVDEKRPPDEKEIGEVLKLYGHQEGYKRQVFKSRVEQDDSYLIEPGQTLRARRMHNGEEKHLKGSLGCFLLFSPRDPNVKEKSISSDPGTKVSSAFTIKEREIHAITCAHCVLDCDTLVDVKSGDNFVPLGPKKCEVYIKHILDVATIAVDPLRQSSCDSKLKRFDQKCTNQWNCFSGNPCGKQVQKEGAITKFTKGVVISADYASKHMCITEYKSLCNGIQDGRNILIKPLADVLEEANIMEGGPIERQESFSEEGDSGSVICSDNPENNSVFVVSLLMGGIETTEEQRIGAIIITKKYYHSYSSHFETTLNELKERYDVKIDPAVLTRPPM